MSEFCLATLKWPKVFSFYFPPVTDLQSNCSYLAVKLLIAGGKTLYLLHDQITVPLDWEINITENSREQHVHLLTTVSLSQWTEWHWPHKPSHTLGFRDELHDCPLSSSSIRCLHFSLSLLTVVMERLPGSLKIFCTKTKTSKFRNDQQQLSTDLLAQSF